MCRHQAVLWSLPVAHSLFFSWCLLEKVTPGWRHSLGLGWLGDLQEVECHTASTAIHFEHCPKMLGVPGLPRVSKGGQVCATFFQPNLFMISAHTKIILSALFSKNAPKKLYISFFLSFQRLLPEDSFKLQSLAGTFLLNHSFCRKSPWPLPWGQHIPLISLWVKTYPHIQKANLSHHLNPLHMKCGARLFRSP